MKAEESRETASADPINLSTEFDSNPEKKEVDQQISEKNPDEKMMPVTNAILQNIGSPGR